jgi:hypothetical protein
VAVNDDEEKENEFDEYVMVTVPSIKDMIQKMTDTQSRKVPEKVWNGFCDLRRYINNILVFLAFMYKLKYPTILSSLYICTYVFFLMNNL